MKRFSYLLGLLGIVLSSCSNYVTQTVTYKINEPVFMPAETFRSSVKVTATAHKISKLGKMCFYNDYLYISEPDKGIHIIDNRNPKQPAIVGFIELMGNAELAIREGKLYADSYIDLVWFDISNPASPTPSGRLDSIFTTALPPTENTYGIDYLQCYGAAKDKGIVVGWKLTERTEEVQKYTGGWWGGGGMIDDVAYSAETSNSGTKSSTGINGSMSKFALHGNYLYSVLNNSITIFDLSGSQPKKAAENTYAWWNVETVFGYKDNLFLGTPTGMVIYSIADPLKPTYASSVQHVFGCDPVVVDNDLAYVTVHSEANRCGQTANELMVIDVKDVTQPKTLATYAMTQPKGLGIDSGKLFLCDDGLKIFKITTPETLLANKIAQFKDMNGYDVIANNHIVMMIADDGIYQYDYSNENLINFLSKIPIGE
jgi:hypothetical protein